MERGSRPAMITEHDLHAFADEQLTPERRTEVEAWLAENPEKAVEVESWRAQNGMIRSLFPEAAEAATPLPPLRSRQRWMTMAAAVVIFATGVAVGSFIVAGRQPAATGAGELAALPGAAATNFLVYAGEVRHPVEVAANEEAHLVAWLGKRLDTKLKAPDLTGQGFRLIGGRLVPYDGKPGALLMYEDQAGERLTLLVGRNPEASGTGFRYSETDGVSTFYWIDAGLGYALSGRVTRERLMQASDAVYRQL